MALMRFTKSHGAGNDFVVVHDLVNGLDLTAEVVRALCDRRRGVGADGVLRITGDDAADAFMDHRNADGSPAEMCGNGIRVVAKHLVEQLGVAGPEVRIATRGGLKTVEVHRDGAGRVVGATVDMGPPELVPAAIPFDHDGAEAVDVPVDASGEPVRLTAVSMGNPHAVIVVDDVATAPVTTLGPVLEGHERFPKRTNVEFVVPGTGAVRVWERGVGETAACGSGACAVLVALQRLGRADNEVVLHFPGGDLTVRHIPSEHPSVFLTGDAADVFTGEVDRQWFDDRNVSL
ncbi:MAG: diaminopimelate epimerase [Nitriliruptorales bacterium]